MDQDNAAKAKYKEVIKLGLTHTNVQWWDKRTRTNLSEKSIKTNRSKKVKGN